MFFKTRFWWIILFTLFFQIPYTFSGEVYRWTDEKGTIHFTDDVSKIPKPYSDQAERIEVQEETLREVEKIGKPEERPDRVKDYLENIEKKIEMKKSMEKKISELEEELKLSEERLKESRNMKGRTISIISHSRIPGRENGFLLLRPIMKRRGG
jgi:hypothetical protein